MRPVSGPGEDFCGLSVQPASLGRTHRRQRSTLPSMEALRSALIDRKRLRSAQTCWPRPVLGAAPSTSPRPRLRGRAVSHVRPVAVLRYPRSGDESAAAAAAAVRGRREVLRLVLSVLRSAVAVLDESERRMIECEIASPSRHGSELLALSSPFCSPTRLPWPRSFNVQSFAEL